MLKLRSSECHSQIPTKTVWGIDNIQKSILLTLDSLKFVGIWECGGQDERNKKKIIGIE